MTELKMEHVLILAIVVFVLYHFMGRCSCMHSRDGFSVGGDSAQDQQICKNINGYISAYNPKTQKGYIFRIK